VIASGESRAPRVLQAVEPVPFPELGKADTRSGKGTGSTACKSAPERSQSTPTIAEANALPPSIPLARRSAAVAGSVDETYWLLPQVPVESSHSPMPQTGHDQPYSFVTQSSRSIDQPGALHGWACLYGQSAYTTNRSVTCRHAVCSRRVGRCDRRQTANVMEVAVDRNHPVRRSVR